MSNRDLFLYHANKLIGTPYKHQGRNKFGLDCAGLIVYSFKLCNFYEYVDNNSYSRLPNGFKLIEHLDSQLIRLRDKNTYEDGDILIFNIINEPHHMAIYDSGYLLHSTQESDKVVKVGFDKRWKERHSYSYTVREYY